MYLILFFVPLLLAIMAQIMINSAYYKYSNITNNKSYSGEMVARLLLSKTKLNEVDVAVSDKGFFSNYYDPRLKTLHLSENVYYGNSIAAITIAAQEVAHAILHDEQSFSLIIRNNLLPFSQTLLMIGWGILLIGTVFQRMGIMDLGIYTIIAVSAFHIVTWPIEIKARKQVMRLFEDYDVVDEFELEEVNNMSRALSVSYVASIVGLITFIIQFVKLIKRKE